MSAALNELITRVNRQVRECKGKLLVEESGREVASLQGHVAGYRYLTDFLAAEFHLSQVFLEDLGEDETMVPDLDDEAVFALERSCLQLQEELAWKAVLERIEARNEELKDFLLYQAEKSRDLDVSQGQRKAMSYFRDFFRHVGEVATSRRVAAAEKAKNPELEFEMAGV